MNKKLYRVIWSVARAARVVVHEAVTSAGKGTSKAATMATGALAGVAAFAPMLIGAALAGMLTAPFAHAQIVANPMAPNGMRPTILVAPNGVPLINVQSPSAAGVSRNIFNAFNVAPNGVILNNSRNSTSTQLGGMVMGNPFMAGGTARVILAEVNGGIPTQLRGWLEVAGQRAEVVIANPAGLQVDGAGFINVKSATLTTGIPQFNAFGGLDSYVVRSGVVTVNGAGIDLRQTDYAAILAREMQINAAIHATDLKVITGANVISADHVTVTPTAGTGAAPVYALDSSALGGMYSGKITFIGTEAGLGVRNAGTIQAAPGTSAMAGAGQLVVTSAGRLENLGTIQATADANIAASSLVNSGRITSGGNLKIATQDNLSNSGAGTGGVLEGARLELASAAGAIDNRLGTIRQTSSAALTISGPSLSNTGGGSIGVEPPPANGAGGATGTSSGNSGAGSNGAGASTPSSDSGNPGTGAAAGSGTTVTPTPYVPPSPGTLTAATAILNDGGRIYAGGPITLQTPQVNNAGGLLAVASMAVSGPNFSNAGGTLSASQSFSANVGSFDNSGGKLNAGSLNIASSGDLINADGLIVSASDAHLTVGGNADNTRGTLSAAGALTANVVGATTNVGGSMTSNQALTLNSGSLDSTKGSIQSAQAGVQLAVTNALVNGSGGSIGAATDLGVQAGSLSNAGGLRGANDVNVAVTGGMANEGSITAGRNARINTASLTSDTGSILGAGVQNDGKLGSTGDLHVASTGTLSANGTNLAAGNATLQGTSVDLSGSQTSAANIAVTATQGNVTTSGASVVTPGTLSVAANSNAGQTLVNTTGQLNAGQLDLQVANIANTNKGEIVQTGTSATTIVVSGSIDNSNSLIASNGNTTLAANSFTNQAGVLRSANKSDLSITTATSLDNSHQGVIVSSGNATLKTGTLTNDTGSVTAAGDLNATVSAAASNVGGILGANGNTTLAAQTLDSTQGTIAAVKGDLSVTTVGTTTNDKGTLQAAGQTTLTNAGLSNIGGRVFGNSLSIDTHTRQLTNDAGTLAATTTVTLNSGALSNDAGLVQSGGAMRIDTHGQTLTNTNAPGFAGGLGGITSADTLDLKTGDVNSANGYIGSKGALTANSQAFTNTAKGIVLSQSTLTINTNGNPYENSSGQSVAAGDLTLTTGDLRNTGGLIRSLGNTTLMATGAVTNTKTNTDPATQSAQGIDGQNVAISAASLDNSSGAIRANGNTTITSPGNVQNDNGFISALNVLRIVDPNDANTSSASTGSTKTLNLTNGNGTLVGNKGVDLRVGQASLDGKIQSGTNLSVASSGDLSVAQDSIVSAIGNVTLQSDGNVTNAGKITSGNATRVQGNNVENTATGQITSLGTTTVIAQGSPDSTVTNRGLIDGATTLIDAPIVTNIGTGRIYGDQVSIQASTALNNIAETIGTGTGTGTTATTSAATIAARQRLDLGVGTLNNQDGSLILSLGDVNIGGALDANGHATGQATTVNNRAATIQAQGQLNLAAQALNNLNGGVTYTMVDSGTDKHVVQFALQGDPQRYNAADVYLALPLTSTSPTAEDRVWPSFKGVSGSQYGTAGQPPGYSYLIIPALTGYPASQFGAYYQNPPHHSADRSTQVCSGLGHDNAQCTGYSSPGFWYPASDPIWAAFGVAPPVAVPAYLIGLSLDDVVVGRLESKSGVKFDHLLTQAEYDAFVSFIAAHEALDAQTSKFMAAIVGKPAAMNITYLPGPGGLTMGYTYWDYTETGSKPVLQSSAPGKILSGGAMNLNVGGGLNDMSQIMAGGDLVVRGGTIVNQGQTADAQLKQVGTTGTMVGAGSNVAPVVTPYNQTINTTVVLAAAVQQGNVAVDANGTPIAGRNAGGNSGAIAQGSGNVNANTRVSPIRQVPLTVTGSGSATGGNGATSTGTTSRPAPTVVRTTTPNLGVPLASLFRTQPGPSSHYLIETDPAFAQYRTWLSSDYLLNNLGQDPNTTLKRLGDGFYEQQLIREQVAQLTGSRYLDGYGDDQSEYAALMNNGATFARKYNLTPGIALSDAQMAQLTSDIVWLVQQTVTLPDGSTQQVLVPQVYVRTRPGDIDGSGALLAGQRVDMNISGDLLNVNGTIAGRQAVNLSADNIANLGGRISGDSVTAKANTDLLNIGGVIDAQSAVDLQAKRDISMASTTRTSTDALSGRSDTVLDRVAGVYVGGAGQSGATLSMNAGRDLVLAGVIVSNQGTGDKASTVLQADRDVVLGTVTTASSEQVGVPGFGFNRSESRQQQVGTQILAQGDIGVQAGRDLNAQAVRIASSQGNVELGAKGDVNIVSGTQQTTLGAQMGNDKSQNYDKYQVQMDNAQPSVVMGAGNVTVRSGGNMTVEGSVLAAGADAKAQQAINDATQSVDTRRSGTGSVLATGPDGEPRLNHDNANAARDAATPTTGTLTLDAGGTLNLIASQNGLSVGSKGEDGKNRNYQGDGTVTVSNGNQLSGEAVNLRAGGDINSQATVVNANTLNVSTPGTLNLSTAKDSVKVSQSGIDNDAWFVNGGDSGQKNDATRYNQINAKNVNLDVGAVKAQLGGFDTPASLAQQPGMGWVTPLMNDPKYAGKVDWERVKEVHDKWDNTYVGLGPASQAVITIVVAFATAGIGAEAGASVGDAAAVSAGQGMTIEGATFLTDTGVTISAGVSNAVQVGIANLVSTATTSLLNHDGDIGAVLKDLGSSASVKNLVTNMLTAGVLGGLDASGILPANIANATDGTATFTNQLQRQLIDRTAGALIDTAINGGSLERNLQNALANAFLDTAAAQGATLIGANGSTYGNGNLNAFTAQVAHAILGCMVGAGRAGAGGGTSSGNGCSAGAIGAVVGDLAGQLYNPYDDPAYMPQAARVAGLVAGIAGAIVGGDGASANIAAAAGSNAVINNQNAAVNLANRMAPALAQMSEGGIQALSADALAAVQSCLKFTWCSAVVPAAAIGWFAINNPPKPDEPTGAGAIPNEYAPPYRPIGGVTTTPGTALNQPSTTDTPMPVRPDQAGGTSSPMTDPNPDTRIAGGGYGAGTAPNYGGPTITPNNGPRGASVMMSQGTWVSVNESMSDRARDYQTQITGASGRAYVVNGVKFDGVAWDGTLLDAKGPGYGSYVLPNGEFAPWFAGGAQSLVEQARRQSNAANGTAINWMVADQPAVVAIQNLLSQNGFGDIKVIYTPPK